MTPKKFLFMLATGVCLSLFTAAPASACAGGHTLHEAAHAHAGDHDGEGLGARGATVSTSAGVRDARRAAPGDAGARSPRATKFGRAAAYRLQEDDFPESEGSCIHEGGCTCSGPRTHRRGCGTNPDSHAHPGLLCTWASGPVG